MNDMTVLRREAEMDLDERADRIRSLVNVARGCIVEIGRELIEAKAEVEHGQWLPWLSDEFGWSKSTAENYMNVATKFPTIGNLTGITIDATALYALAAPDVPQAARVEAVERAKAGEHISKRDAEAMISEAVAAKAEQDKAAMAAALLELGEQQDQRTAAAIKEATAALRADKQALADKIKEIKQAERGPLDTDALAAILCRALNVKKLSDNHWRLMAQMLGHGIAVGNKTYAPVSREQVMENEQNLRMAAAVTEALSSLAGAAPGGPLLAVCYPVQRARSQTAIRSRTDITGWRRRGRSAWMLRPLRCASCPTGRWCAYWRARTPHSVGRHRRPVWMRSRRSVECWHIPYCDAMGRPS
jgi:hypothetical protein